jgi:hypothetical protein
MMPVDVEICACGTEHVAHQPYRARQPARRARARLPAGTQALARANASTRLDRTTGMRLNPHQRQTIKQAVHTCFGADATVRLFGSRIDDSKRGGDIDLLISTSLTDPDAIARAEIAFQVRGSWATWSERKIGRACAPSATSARTSIPTSRNATPACSTWPSTPSTHCKPCGSASCSA